MINIVLVSERLNQLGYTEITEADTATLNYIYNTVCERVRNFCNISEIPEGLTYTVVDAICAEFLTLKNISGGLGDEVKQGIVNSITEGDVSITFADGGSIEAQFKAVIDGMALKDADLLRFRRLVW